jgi:2'-5' RNA ligase
MGKRNVRKLAFRPPLPRRAVVWFPQFEDSLALERIQRFRLSHDPLAEKLPPHLTLVFPFHANLSVTQLASHIKRSTTGWPALPASFRGVESVQGEFALLMCDLRREAIIELHNRLYRGVLRSFLRDDINYLPHITLGRSRITAEFDAMLADAELRFRDTWRATLRELSILTLADDGTITIEQTVALNIA